MWGCRPTFLRSLVSVVWYCFLSNFSVSVDARKLPVHLFFIIITNIIYQILLHWKTIFVETKHELSLLRTTLTNNIVRDITQANNTGKITLANKTFRDITQANNTGGMRLTYSAGRDLTLANHADRDKALANNAVRDITQSKLTRHDKLITLAEAQH